MFPPLSSNQIKLQEMETEVGRSYTHDVFNSHVVKSFGTYTLSHFGFFVRDNSEYIFRKVSLDMVSEKKKKKTKDWGRDMVQE